jgi:hypothetical protein
MSQVREQASFSAIKRRLGQSQMDAVSIPRDDSRYIPACERHLAALNDVMEELDQLEKSTEGDLSIEIAAYRVDRVQERDRLTNKLYPATQ